MDRMTRTVLVHCTRSEVKGRNVLFLLLLLLTTILLSGLVTPQSLSAAPGDITTIAGGGVGDTGFAASASLYLPRGIHVTPSGVIYVADTLNHRVRKIDTNGIITTVAGNGSQGFSGDGGPATSASLNHPLAITVDQAGNIFIADAHNHRVRKVNASGIISTIIGGGADNAANYCSLPATDAGNLFARDVFLDSSDRVHIIDGQLWRLETDGTLINLSDPSCGYGALETGFSGGFFNASGAFIYASGNNILRTTDMQSSIFLGAFSNVSPGAFPALSGDVFGNIYVASPQSNLVYKLDQAGTSTVFAGTGTAGYSGDGDSAASANLSNPTDVFVDTAGNVYITDRMNHRIRKVDPNGTIITTAGTGEAGYAGDGLTATSEALNLPRGVFVDSAGNVYIADTYNQRIRKIDTAGAMTTIAGNGIAEFSGDGGPASAAGLYYPTGIFVSSDGTTYIADSFNDRIRKIDPTGTITTIAGTDDTGYAGDGGPATDAVLNFPTGVIVDSIGNVFIADFANNAIRKIDSSGIISTYANIRNPRAIAFDSSGVLYVATNYDGVNVVYPNGTVDVMPACFDAVGVSVDSSDTVYIACQNENRIIKSRWPVAGPETVAGTGIEGFSGDNGPGTTAMLATPSSVFVDFSGAIYIADSGNNRIRRIAGSLEPSVIIQSPAAGFTNNAAPLLLYAVSSGTAVVKVDDIVVNKVSGNNLDSLTDGPHTVRVDVTNEYGTGYAERIFTVDTVIPTVAIASPISGTISENKPLLAYTVSEGMVIVKVDGVVVNKVSGNQLAMLTNGLHTVRVESKDTAGNTGFAEVSFTVAAPPTVTISSPVAGSMNTNSPLLLYTVNNGTVVVKVDGAVVSTVSGINLDPLAEGTHVVRVESTNENGTGYSERTFTVDTIAPTVTITSPAVGTTADNQPFLTYTVSDGTVTVKVDGVIANKVSGSRLYILSNGPHTVRVESMDLVGNSGFAEVAFIVNAPIERITEDFETGDFGKLPWVTSGNGLWAVKSAVKHRGMYATEAPISIGDGQSASLIVSRITTSDTISFWYSVSSETNWDFLKFYVDGVQKGKWSGTVPWAQASYPVSAGTHTFMWVYSKDWSVSAGADTAWIDDIVFPMPPAAPTVTITSPVASVTNSSAPLVTYTVSGGAVVVKVDGVVASKVSGNTLDPLVDGTHTLRVEATDANGTGFAERTFTIDTITPTVSISSPLAGTSSNNRPVLTYTVSDGFPSVKVDGNVVSKASGTTLDPLADGTHTVRVEAIDTAGNIGYAETAFTIDTTAPIVTIASPIAGAANIARPVLTYTVSEGTVVVKVDGVAISKVSGDTLDLLLDGSHAVRIEATDTAGNTGFAEEHFTVHGTPPYAIEKHKISAGSSHTVVLRSDGTLWAWGYNYFGQLGDNTTVNKRSPVQIGTDANWVGIAAGGSHTVALKSDGTLWAWGHNNYGQLGINTTVDAHLPVQIGVDANWVGVAAGDTHTVALKSDGTLWAWGSNYSGQLGDGSTVNKISPVKIGNDASWVSISAGDVFTVALKSDGTLWAWGMNWGQLGDGTKVDRHSPVQIGLDNTWVKIAAGGYHTLAIKADGTLWTWGYNYHGQLGDGTTAEKLSPRQLGNEAGWVLIAAGVEFSMAVNSYNMLYTWGQNNYGQLGNGSTGDQHSPVLVGIYAPSPNGLVSIEAGWSHSLIVTASGGLSAWGANYYGQVGLGYQSDSITSAYHILDKVLKNGVISVNKGLSYINSTSVVVDHVVSDSVGVLGMQFSNDGLAWSALEPYATTKDWLFDAGDGTKTVYVKFKDSVGNWSKVYSESVVLDTVTPTVSVSSPVSGASYTYTPILHYTIHYGASALSTIIKVDGVRVFDNLGEGSNGLLEGNHVVRVEATDSAYNVGFAEISFTVDKSAPTISILSPASGITNQKASLLSYTVSDGTVVVKVDGVIVPKVSGNTLDSLADGSHTVRVESADAAGNTGFAEVTFTVDTIAPSVSIASPLASATNNNRPMLTFTVSDGTVVVKVNGNVVSKASGTTLDPLADGTHTVRVESTDAAGNTGFAEVTLTIDTTAPTVTISAPTVGVTNNTRPMLTYTVSDGSVVVKVDGVVVPKVSGNTLDILTEGSHTVRVESTDAAGNIGFGEVTFTVDTIAPTISLSSPVAGATKSNTPLLTYTVSDGTVIVKVDGAIVSKISGNNLDALTDGTHSVRVESTDAAGNVGFAEVTFIVDTVPPAISINPVNTLTNVNSQIISGTRESGAIITVALNTATTAGAPSYPNDTTWSCTISGLVEGINTITVTATDSVGNSATAQTSITYDSVAPIVTISSPSVGNTNNNKPVLTYVVSDGAVFVKIDGNVVQKVSGNTLDALMDGVHTVSVESTDQAGNKGFAEVTVIVDTLAPTVVIASPAAGITKNNAPLLSYTVSDGTVVVKVDGIIVPKLSGSALDALADGTHSVRVESTDGAGNTGSAQVSFTVDTLAPALTINAVASPTNVSSQTISGTRESDAAITVSVNTAASVGSVGYPTATTWSCAITGLVTGGNAITMTVTDIAGNSASIGTSITLDIAAPTVTIASPVSGTTNNKTPVLTYTASDGIVVVKVDGTIVYKVSGNNLDSLSDGSHMVRVEATDAAGNTGFATVTFTVDTIAPTITMNSVTSPTHNKTQTVSGTRESGSTVTVKANTFATIGAVSYPSATTWSCTISSMVTGVNTITATAKDAANNTASASRSITVK